MQCDNIIWRLISPRHTRESHQQSCWSWKNQSKSSENLQCLLTVIIITKPILLLYTVIIINTITVITINIIIVTITIGVGDTFWKFIFSLNRAEKWFNSKQNPKYLLKFSPQFFFIILTYSIVRLSFVDLRWAQLYVSLVIIHF